MGKEIRKTIPIPEGVMVKKEGNVLTVSGELGTLTREFTYPNIVVDVQQDEVVVDTRVPRRIYKAMVGTFASHIQNMIKGVREGYRYELKVVFSHFPIQLSVEEGRVVIQNFLGERSPRYASIVGDTNVEISGDRVIVSGINKEDVGQTAANIEQATRIKRLDPRVFQDGVYIVAKGE
ncbi:50S ribosomal protein L6 [Methermicoccus shengliensis]|uniref:Large ribosomal subunit protein uL6 n=1 Tax=Methermicoccus shengliensis TaxID=660064 RepID=A0A832RS99_9EURY|nr:50S ribosomal protein L6 [Methermicoccus shengliensis]KUK05103.1 MAG: 50S ribosomal protein L6 [Euryarchaeota archaeon 55_53]KUK30396.1 MAG: 50S ribosomal protein L6 [Methanosarcinales archeaon 56_1174]MDI3488419.1 large subunit ribosomal protein [Methanosarcinales archaeon]MDN5294662.1 large subunit ribosomal protein [Methanosarcinales archaeon]HIH69373.1 50S ribosomal protein L6 [Methermicoccus shengliensis]